MTFLPYSFLLILSAILAFGLAVYGWRHRQVPGAKAFSLFQILMVAWPLVQAVDINTADLGLKILLMKIRFDAPVFAGVAFWAMAAQLTERGHLVTRRRLAALCIIPILGMILNWTSPNPLFRYGYHLNVQGPFPVLRWTNGPLYQGWFLYVMALYLSPLYLLWRSHPHLSPLSVRQSFIISISVLFPMGVNILFHLGIMPLPGLNMVPIAQSVASLIIVWAIFQYNVFEVIPIARGLLISSMSDGVVVLDAKNRIVDINPSAQKMIGPTARTAFGASARDVFAPWPNLIARFLGVPVVQTEIALEGDEPHYLDLKIEPLNDRHGKSMGRMIVFRDITQCKKTEEALRQSREQFRVILTSIGDGVITTGASGRITFLNPIAQAMTGWLPKEAIGQPVESIFRIINEKTNEPAEDIVRRVLRDGSVVTLANNTALINREGQAIPIEDSAAPILDADKNVTGVVLVFHDVTEKRRAQIALAESEKRYRTLFATMTEGFALHETICDDQGRPCDYRFLQVNPAFERLTGLKAADLVGRTLYEVLPQSESLWVERYGAVALTGQPAHFEQWSEALGKHFEISAFQTERGYFGVVFIDVTERKQAEEALRASRLAALNLMEDAVEARQKAEQISSELEARVQQRTAELSKAVDELQEEIFQRQGLEKTLQESEKQVRFFASQYMTAQETERKRIAAELHDSIAASLAAIKYTIEKTQTEMRNNGLAPSQSLQGLVDTVQQTIVETRRIMADLRPSILDDLGLIAAMNWFWREYQKTYSQTAVDCRIGLSEDDLPHSIKTPIFRISQEALNNIAKHSQAGRVDLSLQKVGQGIQLTIQDNGRGFDLNKVVKGFGLSTMRERAELSGGVFTIESGEGGTTIQASWPLG